VDVELCGHAMNHSHAQPILLEVIILLNVVISAFLYSGLMEVAWNLLTLSSGGGGGVMIYSHLPNNGVER